MPLWRREDNKTAAHSQYSAYSGAAVESDGRRRSWAGKNTRFENTCVLCVVVTIVVIPGRLAMG